MIDRPSAFAPNLRRVDGVAPFRCKVLRNGDFSAERLDTLPETIINTPSQADVTKVTRLHGPIV